MTCVLPWPAGQYLRFLVSPTSSTTTDRRTDMNFWIPPSWGFCLSSLFKGLIEGQRTEAVMSMSCLMACCRNKMKELNCIETIIITQNYTHVPAGSVSCPRSPLHITAILQPVLFCLLVDFYSFTSYWLPFPDPWLWHWHRIHLSTSWNVACCVT